MTTLDIWSLKRSAGSKSAETERSGFRQGNLRSDFSSIKDLCASTTKDMPLHMLLNFSQRLDPSSPKLKLMFLDGQSTRNEFQTGVRLQNGRLQDRRLCRRRVVVRFDIVENTFFSWTDASHPAASVRIYVCVALPPIASIGPFDHMNCAVKSS